LHFDGVVAVPTCQPREERERQAVGKTVVYVEVGLADEVNDSPLMLRQTRNALQIGTGGLAFMVFVSLAGFNWNRG
jgi:hypothetical protein